MALLASLTTPAASLAHGGSARLAAEPDTVRPGGIVTMRGEDLGSDAFIALALIGPTGHVPLGAVLADEEGHLASSVQIPVGLPVGMYRLEGSPDGATPLAVSLLVQGEPLPTGQDDPGQGGRDDDDGLLIALPSGWQRSLGQPPITAAPVITSSVGQIGRGPDPAVAVGIVVVALLGALGVGAVARRRHPA